MPDLARSRAATALLGPAFATSPLAGTALTTSVERSAREFRLASTGRAELGKLLAANDLRRLADADPELNAELAAASAALTASEKAAAAWQKALADATKRWQASLAELTKLHP